MAQQRWPSFRRTSSVMALPPLAIGPGVVRDLVAWALIHASVSHEPPLATPLASQIPVRAVLQAVLSAPLSLYAGLAEYVSDVASHECDMEQWRHSDLPLLELETLRNVHRRLRFQTHCVRDILASKIVAFGTQIPPSWARTANPGPVLPFEAQIPDAPSSPGFADQGPVRIHRPPVTGPPSAHSVPHIEEAALSPPDTLEDWLADRMAAFSPQDAGALAAAFSPHDATADDAFTAAWRQFEATDAPRVRSDRAGTLPRFSSGWTSPYWVGSRVRCAVFQER